MTGEVKIISRTRRTINGKYYARVRYKIDDGKPLEILRCVENRSAVRPKLAEIEVDLLKNGPQQLVAGKVTFRQLAQHAKDNVYVPAVYDDQETKIKGVRSVVPAHAALNNLVAFFGDTDIRKINEKTLTEYQVARLTGTIKDRTKVSLSTVDRELSKARKLFNIAVDEGWLLRSPFTRAVSRNLIHDASETPDPIKTRELTDEEAALVIKALDTPERRHTLPVFIAAMDTGARRSSLLDYLRWKDINFGDEIIIITAYKGKGRNVKPKRWPVQMTGRLKKELLQLQLQRKNKNDDALVFEETKVNLRKLWTAAYAEAGVPKGTRLFYSVRHNFGTEMANEGMPLPALANLLGHSDPKMTMRYYNLNKKTIDKARDILNRRAVANHQ
jgi:integrase